VNSVRSELGDTRLVPITLAVPVTLAVIFDIILYVTLDVILRCERSEPRRAGYDSPAIQARPG
jgi:hypothetical protein